MAVRRPLKIINDSGICLKQMSDSEIRDIAKMVQHWHATRMYNFDGYSFGGSTWTNSVPGIVYRHYGGYYYAGGAAVNMDQLTDSYYASTYNTQTDDYGYPAGDNWYTDNLNDGREYDDDDSFSAPSIGAIDTRQTYSYQTFMPYNTGQYNSPSIYDMQEYGYIVHDNGSDIRPENSHDNIIDTILREANDQSLNGNEIGSFRVATSTPGGSHWYEMQNDFFSDHRSSGTSWNDINNTTQQTRWNLYLNLGYNISNGTDVVSFNDNNTPVQWRNFYHHSMVSGTAVTANDYSIEGTYTGTLYIKTESVYGDFAWSTNNSTWTSVSLTSYTSSYIYPTGNSADGYFGVRLNDWNGNAPHSWSYYAVGHNGMEHDARYVVNNVYRYDSEKDIRRMSMPNVRALGQRDPSSGGVASWFDDDMLGDMRISGLLMRVLMPLYYAYYGGSYNMPYYSISSNANLDNGTSIRKRGHWYDTYESSTSTVMTGPHSGTYYHVRYANGGVTTAWNRYLYVQAKV